MAKQLKNTRMSDEMINAIQEVADSTLDGNFTSATEELINQSLCLRKLSDRTLHVMYSSVSHDMKSKDAKNLRNLIDGLNI